MSKQTSRKIKGVMVHCTATAPSFMEGNSLKAQIAEIARWHVEDRGWRAIGYDQLIGRDGGYGIGRDLDKDGIAFEDVGAHAAGHNTDYVSVAVFGGHGSNADDKFSDHFTADQEARLVERILYLKKRFGANIEVIGHNQFANKACPGFNVPAWWAEAEGRYIAQAQAPVLTPLPAPRPVAPDPQPDGYRADMPQRDSPWKLNTIRAQLVGWFGTASLGARALWSEQDPIVQGLIVGGVIVLLFAGGIIFRDRIRKFVAGIR